MSGASERPRGRVLACLALLVLGALAASRIELSYLPRTASPEVGLSLVLAEPGDLEAVARDWVVPLEAAVRAAGDSRSLTGSVHARGADLRVRLAAGVDPERKVARLDSELARLRERLGDRGSLWTWPGAASAGPGNGSGGMVLWLDGEWSRSERRRLREALLALEAVRAVSVAGEGSRTLRVELPRGSDREAALSPAQVESTLAAARAERRFGSTKTRDRRVEVLGRSTLDASGIERLPWIVDGGARVGVERFGSLAELSLVEEPPERRARLDGRDGLALMVDRETESTPLALRRAVERALAEGGWSERTRPLFDESEPLLLLVRRHLVALLTASLLAAAVGFLLGGARSSFGWALVLPVAASAALNALLLFGRSLDVTTLPLASVGLAAAPLVYALRAAGAPARGLVAALAVSAAAPWVAVRLTGGPMAPLLDEPSRTFLLTSAAASVAALLPPALVPSARGLGTRWGRRVLGGSLRLGATVVLLVSTCTYALLAISGRALTPRAGVLSPPFGDLAIDVRFVEGTTLEQAGERMAAVEAHLRAAGLEPGREAGVDLERVWSLWDEARGSMRIEVDRALSGRARLERIARRLESQLSRLPLAVRVVALAGGGDARAPIRFRERLETEAEVDELAASYRMVLRSPQLAPLRETEDRIRERLTRYGVRREELLRGWGAPGERVELVPRAGSSAAAVERAVADLGERLRFPRPRPFVSEPEIRLQVRSAVAPPTPDDLPPVESLRAADAVFDLERALTPPRVQRENGRFVLPLDLRMRFTPPRRLELVPGIDRMLSQLQLAGSVELERPVPERWAWRAERWRMLAVVLALPVLLLAGGVCRLDSVPVGVLALVPGAAAVAAVAPLLEAGGGADELSLLSLGAMLCIVLPVSWEVTARAAVPLAARGAGALHRRIAPWVAPLLAALGVVVVGFAAAAVGLSGERWAWVSPAWVAVIAGGVGLLGSVTVAPALQVGWSHWRSGRTRRGRALARPAAWRDLGAPGDAGTLTLRNLTKIHPRRLWSREARDGSRDPRARPDGFWALSGLSLELESGIVGLLGPNGAGKTTLLRLLCGMMEPTRGQVRFRDVPVSARNLPVFRRQVGFLPQGFNVDERLTGRAFLDHWALERGLLEPAARRREIDRVVELVGLAGDVDRRVRELSGGMRRRVGIARALLGDPPILIVDEPTTGLDVDSRNQLRRSLLEVAERRIILFSTHIASDVAAAASRIVVLHLGRLQFDGSGAELVGRARGRVVRILVADRDLQEIGRRHRVTTRVRTPRGVRLRLVLGSGEAVPPGAEPVEPNLEEAYLALMAEATGTAGDAVTTRSGALDWLGTRSSDGMIAAAERPRTMGKS